MMQNNLEEAREEVAKMAKEVAKALSQQGELKEEVEKLRQGMHQILESARESRWASRQIFFFLVSSSINPPGRPERCDGDSPGPRDPLDNSRCSPLLW